MAEGSNPLDGKDFVKPDFLLKEIERLNLFKKTIIDLQTEIVTMAEKTMKSLQGVTGAQKEGQKTIEKSEEEVTELTKAFDKYDKSLEDTEKEIVKVKSATKEQNQINKLNEKLNRSTVGSYDALSAQYSKNKIRLNAMSKAQREGTKSGKALEKESKEIFQEMNKLQKATGKATLQVGDYGGEMSKAGGVMGAFGGGVTGIIGKFNLLLTNPIIAFFAAIAAVVGLLVKSMSRGEEGQDRLNKVMKVAGSILDNVMDVISDLAIFLFDNFPNILERFGNRFMIMVKDVQSGILSMRIAWNKLTGDADEADKLIFKLKDISADTENLANRNTFLSNQMAEGFKVVTEAAKNLGHEIRKDIDAAQALADLEAKFNRDERGFIVENSKLRNESAKLRAKAEEVKLIQAKESISLTEQAFELDEKVLANEIDLAKQRLKIAQETSALALDDIESKKAIAQAEADLNNAQTAFDEKRRERTRKLNSFRREAEKQERERLADRVQLEKILQDQRIRDNEELVDNEKSTNSERITALQDTSNIRRKLIEQASDLELKELESLKKLKLINDEDYALKRKLIEEEAKNDTLNILRDTQNEIDELIDEQQSKGLADRLGLSIGDEGKQSLSNSTQFVKDGINSVVNTKINAAQKIHEVSRKEIEDAQSNLDEQIALQKAGEKANVAGALSLLQAKKEIGQKALKEQERLQKAQNRIDNVQTIGSLVTASANLWKQSSKLGPILGPIAAIAAIGTMFGSFIFAKAQARKVSKFGSGGSFNIGGGSHSSGNDTSLGVHNGVEMRVEKGEKAGIFSRGAVNRYGSEINEVIKSMNKGTFSRKHGKTFTAAADMPDYIIAKSGADSADIEDLMNENIRLRDVLKETVKKIPQPIFNITRRGMRKDVIVGNTLYKDVQDENSYES